MQVYNMNALTSSKFYLPKFFLLILCSSSEFLRSYCPERLISARSQCAIEPRMELSCSRVDLDLDSRSGYSVLYEEGRVFLTGWGFSLLLSCTNISHKICCIISF